MLVAPGMRNSSGRSVTDGKNTPCVIGTKPSAFHPKKPKAGGWLLAPLRCLSRSARERGAGKTAGLTFQDLNIQLINGIFH